jgi:hypothetical protein
MLMIFPWRYLTIDRAASFERKAGIEVRLDDLIPVPWSLIEDARDDGYTRVVDQNADGPPSRRIWPNSSIS